MKGSYSKKKLAKQGAHELFTREVKTLSLSVYPETDF